MLYCNYTLNKSLVKIDPHPVRARNTFFVCKKYLYPKCYHQKVGFRATYMVVYKPLKNKKPSKSAMVLAVF